jgi:cell division protein FtsB
MSAATAVRRKAPLPRPHRRPNLHVVEEPRRRHPVLFLSLLVALIMAIVFGAVSLNALAAADAVAIRDLDARLSQAQRDYERLVADVAALEDPERIRRAAEGLGMVPGTSPRYVVLDRSLPADDQQATATDDLVKPVLSAQP